MPINTEVGAFSTFRITTTTDVITFLRSRTTANSEAAADDTATRAASIGCSFELNEPALILYADGSSWTGGRVLSVVQVPDTENEPTP